MNNICIIGSGFMAAEHAKAAINLNYEKIYVVGRTRSSFNKFHSEIDSKKIVPIVGGLEKWAEHKSFDSNFTTILATSVESLESQLKKLINIGVKNILLEKPGAVNHKALLRIRDLITKSRANVYLGYNRRFYKSVEKLIDILKSSNITSFSFEFTEWVDRINAFEYDQETLTNWILANSAHVIDTVFYIIDSLPSEIYSISTGKNKISWHPKASTFVGCGKVKNIPFNYSADWSSQGRWSISFLTEKGKYKLEPMEELYFIKKNSVNPVQIELKHENSKPGLEGQLIDFEKRDFSQFADIDYQIRLSALINKIIS